MRLGRVPVGHDDKNPPVAGFLFQPPNRLAFSHIRYALRY
jgi:hypothetical protein